MRALVMMTLAAFMFTLPVAAANAAKKCKSAKSGQYVTAKYAKKHPSTTYCAATKK